MADFPSGLDRNRASPRRGTSANQRESGGGEIRTHGAVRLNGFQDRPVRPLRHPAAPDSVAGVEGGGTWGNHGFLHGEGRPVRPLRHPAAASSVAAVATMKDLDKLALAMPEATKELEDGRPVYKVHGKMFCFHRSRRPDAVDPDTGERLDDVLVFRVADLGMKEMLLSDARGIYFTTPHWNGYSAVLMRIPELGELDRDELRDLVEEAWLTRAQKRLAKEWLARE